MPRQLVKLAKSFQNFFTQLNMKRNCVVPINGQPDFRITKLLSVIEARMGSQEEQTAKSI
jgi:hypothetical protein